MALLKHFAGFSVVEHGAQIVEQLIFRGTSSFAGKGIAFVARPAARIILPNGPMRGSSVAHHQEFTAVVPLWDAPYGAQEGDGQFHFVDVATVKMTHAPQVVVLSKNHQMFWVTVKVVVGQHIVEALQATSPAFTFIKGSAKGLGHRKVHQELHLRVVTDRKSVV